MWRDKNGHLLTYPWVRPPDPFPPEKGEICTNHPRFLEKKTEETGLAMAIKPYAFHIDDPLGTATVLRGRSSGCFCQYCMAGFREYLKKKVSPEQLHAVGVTDLATFDYGQFLRDRPDRPLWYEFENFHLRSSVEHVKRISQYAERKRGEHIPVGANAPVVGWHIVFAPYLDYIAAEVGTDAKYKKFGGKPMLNYKMGDALDVAIAATGIYQDWVMLTNHDIPDLVRGWVAESYAMGGNFIVPHKEWGFIQPPGKEPISTAYPAKVELIGSLYQFVRDNAQLFDAYEAVTQVALLYDYRASRGMFRGQEMPQTPGARPTELHEICLDLANANVPFGMVVSGSEPFDHELTPDDLKKFEYVIVNEPVMVEGRQKALLDSWEQNHKVIRWRGLESVRSKFRTLVKVEPEGNIWALPRVIPGRRDTPLICHVLNRAFDGAADRISPQKEVTVSLHKEVFGGRGSEKCMLYVERRRPAELPVRAKGEMIEVTIPELELWDVLKFT
jgi:hypothetical protein